MYIFFNVVNYFILVVTNRGAHGLRTFTKITTRLRTLAYMIFINVSLIKTNKNYYKRAWADWT
jgi:hypothetical protein